MLFYLVLSYIIIFYSQIGSRIPMLGSLRIELVFGMIILVIILLRSLNKVQQGSSPKGLNYALILFFASVLISIPTSFWGEMSVNMVIRLSKLFSIYIMIVATVDSEEKLRKFMWVYMMMVFVIVGEPFWQAITGGAQFDTHRGYEALHGATGLWAHPNSLGGFAAANLPFLYFLFKGERSRGKRLILIVIGLCSVGTVVYTGSRTAYVGVLGVAAVIWWFEEHKMKRLVMFLVGLLILINVAPRQYGDRFATLKEIPDVVMETREVSDSMETRWQIIKDAWSIFVDHPISGVGVGAFMTARGAKFDRWQDTHNLYLQVLAELGIIGAVAFAMVLYHIFRNLTLSRHFLRMAYSDESRWLSALTSALMVFLVARLIVGMFGMDLYENYWWLAGGLSIAVLRISHIKAVDGPHLELG